MTAEEKEIVRLWTESSSRMLRKLMDNRRAGTPYEVIIDTERKAERLIESLGMMVKWLNNGCPPS